MSALASFAGSVGDLSPEAQLANHLKTMPPHMQERMRSRFDRIAGSLEGVCPLSFAMAEQGFSARYIRGVPQRHMLVAYAPDVLSTAMMVFCEMPWSDLQAEGKRLVARAQHLGLDPRRALVDRTYEALASRQMNQELFGKLLAMATVVVPTDLAGSFPIAWTMALGDGTAVTPVLMPPTLQEIETGTWEVSP